MKQYSVQSHIDTTVISASGTTKKIPLETVIYPNDKICRLARLVNWTLLDQELGFIFKSENAPSSRLVLGLLYLQSIENLSFADVIAKWKSSPEWQYFCGEKYLSEMFPIHDASLSIWSRVVGTQGRETMVRALGSVNRNKTMH